MRFNINFVKPAEPAEPGSIMTEARARIIWGEPPSSVRDYLTSKGISDSEAESAIARFCAERNGEIRRIGVRNTFIGAILVCGGGVTVYLCLRLGYSSGFLRGAVAGMIGVLFGIWKLYSGIIDLVRPQAEHRSVPDISGSDPVE
jgi:hypothetical protein